jgi:hypothetical protein
VDEGHGHVKEERHEPLVAIKVGRRLRPVTSRFILAVIGIVGGIWAGGTCIGPMWVRPWAAPRDIATVRAEVTAARQAAESSVTVVRQQHDTTRLQVRALAEQQQLTNYVLCVFLRRAQPDLLPPRCSETISTEQQRQREENGR